MGIVFFLAAVRGLRVVVAAFFGAATVFALRAVVFRGALGLVVSVSAAAVLAGVFRTRVEVVVPDFLRGVDAFVSGAAVEDFSEAGFLVALFFAAEVFLSDFIVLTVCGKRAKPTVSELLCKACQARKRKVLKREKVNAETMVGEKLNTGRKVRITLSGLVHLTPRNASPTLANDVIERKETGYLNFLSSGSAELQPGC